MRFLVRRSLRDSSSWPQRLFFSTSHSGFSSIHCRASTPHVRKISPRSLCLLLLCCPRQPQPQGFGRIASDYRWSRTTHEAFWPVVSSAAQFVSRSTAAGGGLPTIRSRHRRPSPPRARPTPALLLLFVPVRSLRRHACVSSAVIRDGQPVTRPCRRSAPRRSILGSSLALAQRVGTPRRRCSAKPPWILPVVRSQLACSTRVALVAVRWLVELASARTGLVQYARLKTLPQSSAAAWTPAPSAGCRTEGSGSTTAAKESSRPQVGIRHPLHHRAAALAGSPPWQRMCPSAARRGG
jgi:hypothetical protein